MDVRTGEIHNIDELDSEMIEQWRDAMSPGNGNDYRARKLQGLAKYLLPMEIPPTPDQLKRKPPRVGRNEPCPCGSGRKFKKCCLVKQKG